MFFDQIVLKSARKKAIKIRVTVVSPIAGPAGLEQLILVMGPVTGPGKVVKL